MKNFKSPTTGYLVSFISRYQSRSDYRLERRSENTRLSVTDDGSASIHLGGMPTAEHLTAMQEYREEENRQYQDWRKENTHLFGPITICDGPHGIFASDR